MPRSRPSGAADGVRAAVALVPRGTRCQRNALGTAQEISVTECLEQHAAVIGQDNHDRPGVGKQVALSLRSVCEFNSGHLGHLGKTPDGGEAAIDAASPGAGNAIVNEPGRYFAALGQQMAGMSQGSAYVLGCHIVSSSAAVPAWAVVI